MTHTTRRSFKILGTLGKIIFALCLTAGSTTHGQDQPKTSKGTVNIALANAKGIVLLTDSAISYKDARGKWQHTQPGQKLFRLDDKTVCSFAGFASETGGFAPELDIEVSGIIAEVRDQLFQHPVPDLDAKLHALAFLVGSYIDLVANRDQLTIGTGAPEAYKFEVIVAGYDADGEPKLKKLVLIPSVTQISARDRYWSHTTSPEESKVEFGLAHLLGGIQTVSHQVLDSPEEFKKSLAIQKYARSRKNKSGNSLTLNDLAALAREMKAQTEIPFAGFVGGPDQIALLSEGKILRIDQPNFAEPHRPLKVSLMANLEVQGANAVSMLLIYPNYHKLWIGSELVGIKNPPLQLDGQFFYKCEIRDSLVEYNGGLLDFGPTNTVVNSALFPWLPVGAAPGKTRRWNGFDWNEEAPNTPSLPTTIGPRKAWGPFFAVPPTT